MSKKEEILHKLSTEDRNYIKEKFKDLETKLAESEVIIKGGKEEIKDLHRKINEIVERDMNCIQQLKQQLAEERKKVVQEIDCELYNKMVVYGDAPSYTDIHSILNKIKENGV